MSCDSTIVQPSPPIPVRNTWTVLPVQTVSDCRFMCRLTLEVFRVPLTAPVVSVLLEPIVDTP